MKQVSTRFLDFLRLITSILLVTTIASCSSIQKVEKTDKSKKKNSFTITLSNSIKKLKETDKRAKLLLASKKTDLDTRKNIYRVLEQNYTIGSASLYIVWGQAQRFQYKAFWNSSPSLRNWKKLYPEYIPFKQCEDQAQWAGLDIENQGVWLFDRNNPNIDLLHLTSGASSRIIHRFEQALIICGHLTQPKKSKHDKLPSLSVRPK